MPLIVVLAGIDYRRGELKGTWLIVICLMAAGSYLVLWAAERMVELRDK